MRWAALIVVVVGAVALAAVLVGLAEAVQRPIERHASIAVAGWPAGRDPLRIALVSDIHLGNRAMRPARLRAIVGQIDRARPDVVLIAGDFVVGHAPAGAVERAAALTAPLAKLRAPLGVVAVLGDHDHWTAPAAIRRALGQAAIAALDNEAARRGPVTIIGIGDAFSGHDDVPLAVRRGRALGGLPIVLTHTPDVVHALPPGLPLVLAGHTHCGQIVLPLVGPLVSRGLLRPTRRLYDPRYRCGIVGDSGRVVVVTAGVGSGTAPIRIGAPPDWWLLTLGAAGAISRP